MITLFLLENMRKNFVNLDYSFCFHDFLLYNISNGVCMNNIDEFSTDKYFEKLNAYWRASNYLSVAQLYLLDNPLLREHKLSKKDIKPKLVGHWGTVPGQNFIYAHCDRVIKKFDLDMIMLSGPGHGGNFFVANSYLEGTYSEYYPEISQNKKGMTRLCKQFSFPGGIGSHNVPENPGSIHEGGELGYSLAHAYGAIFDNPNLIAVVAVGDGEAETGPLATSWHSNKFVNAKSDGAVLPVLHLNGYKISNPTVLSRISHEELQKLFEGYGYKVYFVEGDEPMSMHKKMAEAMDCAIEDIKNIQYLARKKNDTSRKPWPMIVLRTPKGWTGPKQVGGKQIEGTFRAHQIPVAVETANDLKIVEKWLKSYKPEELFDKNYKLKAEIAEILPTGDRRMSANPVTNGGLLLKELKTPKLESVAVKFEGRGTIKRQDMLELGNYIREVFKLNAKNKNYRIFSPDEAMSNRLYPAFEVENRVFNAQRYDYDDKLSFDGRIMDAFLSEHMCEGWLEGYLLTGRHGMFDSYAAFIKVVDSMVSQHAKWLKCCNEISWRKPISSLNLILTSNAWQQDHNGFTHQDPGFLGNLADKKPYITRIFLPVDSNTLIACYDKCAKSKNFINAIVASKHPSFEWLSMKEAKEQVENGVTEWTWAGMNDTKHPDIVLCCAGHTPTDEILGAVTLLKKYLPKLNVKVVNVLELMKLDKREENPFSLTDEQFDNFFTKDKPVVFAFHGYPQLVKSLIFNRNNKNFVIRGYKEEGTITTAFDMRVRNEIDRYHLVLDVLDKIDVSEKDKEKISKQMKNKLSQHEKFIKERGLDMPDFVNWKWEE